jgi:hypothetical protein
VVKVAEKITGFGRTGKAFLLCFAVGMRLPGRMIITPGTGKVLLMRNKT